MEDIKIFKINKNFQVRCWTTYQKDGFCHYAEWNGIKTRIKYLNRTWEEFTYQAVLKSLAKKLKREGYAEGKKLERFLERKRSSLISQDLKTLRMLGKMAEIFLETGQEKVAEGIVRGIAKASGIEPPKKIEKKRLKGAIKILKDA